MAFRRSHFSIWGRHARRACAVAACLLAIALAQGTTAGQKGRTMTEPYSTASCFLLLIPVDGDKISGLESLEVTDPRMVALFYRKDTNRIVILGDDDGRKEIPTFSTEINPLTPGASVVLMNEAGDFDTVIFDTNLDPLIDMGGDIPGFNAAGVRWPEGDARLGEFLQVRELIQESPRNTGEPDQNRHVMGWQLVPHVMQADVVLDLNNGANVTLVEGAPGYRIFVTDLIFHSVDAAAMTADGAVRFTGGGVITSPLFNNLDDPSTTYAPLRIESFWPRGGDDEDLIYDPNTLEGTARTCKVDVIGYYKPAV